MNFKLCYVPLINNYERTRRKDTERNMEATNDRLSITNLTRLFR